jgi:hypothetical protein
MHLTSSGLADPASQRSQRLPPLVAGQRFPRPEIDPERAELCRARCLRCVCVDVNPSGDFEPHEAGSDDRRLKL